MAACDSFRTEEVIKAISQDEYSDLDEISDKGSTSSEHGDFDQSDSSGSEQSEDTLPQPRVIRPAGRRKNTSSADKPKKNLCIDESVVKFKGRLSF